VVQDRALAVVQGLVADQEAVRVAAQVVVRVPDQALVQAQDLEAGLDRVVDQVQALEPEAAQGTVEVAEVVTTRRPLYLATQALRTSHRYHQPF
jgi:hypothetical protein